MKKSIRIISFLIVGLLMLCACSKDEERSGEQTESKDAIKLVVGVFGNKHGFGTGLETMISEFNRSQDCYQVSFRDYGEQCNYNLEEALTILHTEIISGRGPDMLCFSSFSPFPYISSGLLLDLESFLENDSEINSEDISIAKALQSLGGIYFISGGFSFETAVADFTQFGDRYGWTLEEYLEIESRRENVPTLYNITTERFLENIAARYIRKGIDWENGTCNFNDSEFYEILKASMRVQKYPENLDDTNYGLVGALDVMDGKLVASFLFVNNVDSIAQEEKWAGCRMSYIGWPTVDGACGTDAKLFNPIGIMSNSKNPDGCWEFIRYMLLYYDKDNREFSLPMYLPELKKQLEDAQNREGEELCMTKEEADRFLDLLFSIENIALYDPTVMEIIMEESTAFLDGNKTAEEVSAIIQSKVSLYIAERS